jgi:hypothetical protein
VSGEEPLASSVSDKPAVDRAVLKREVGAWNHPAVCADAVKKEVHGGSGVGRSVVDLAHVLAQTKAVDEFDVGAVLVAKGQSDVTSPVQVIELFDGQLLVESGI